MDSHYAVFTDESYVTDSRFRSIAALSLPSQSRLIVEQKLLTIIEARMSKEFKWKDLSSHKHRDCATELLRCVIDATSQYDVRVDVLIWDTHDSRHSIQGRDDRANFERMFYHLLTTSMKRRKRGATWSICPDEKNDVDWSTVKDCLSATGRQRDYHPLSEASREFLSDSFFQVNYLQELHSHERPFLQVADLFAGLSVFSRTNYDEYDYYLMQKKGFGLFDLPHDTPKELSNSTKARCEVLSAFDKMCKDKKLRVSLKTDRRLVTKKQHAH